MENHTENKVNVHFLENIYKINISTVRLAKKKRKKMQIINIKNEKQNIIQQIF